VLQLGIGFDHGVVANHNLFRQGANAWQLISALQNPGIYGIGGFAA
jgi:hypothetical protein